MAILRYLDVLPDALLSAISNRCDLQSPNYEQLSYFVPFQSLASINQPIDKSINQSINQFDRCSSLIEQIVVIITRQLLIPTLQTLYVNNQSIDEITEPSDRLIDLTGNQSIDSILGNGGVEFWLHSRSVDQGMFAHFDRDETRWNETKTAEFPLLSSVMYLSDAGGPTIIRHQSTNQSMSQLIPADAIASIAWPRINSLIVFPGTFLHGVLPINQSINDSRRVTLMINVWPHKLEDQSCIVVQPYDQMSEREIRKYRDRFGKPLSSNELTRIDSQCANSDKLLCGFLHVELPNVDAQSAVELLPIDLNAYREDCVE